MIEILEILNNIIDLDYPNLTNDERELKIERWLRTPNMNFGNSSPQSLIDAGREHKILLYLQNINH